MCNHLKASVVVLQEGSSKYDAEYNAFLGILKKKPRVEEQDWSRVKNTLVGAGSIVELKPFGNLQIRLNFLKIDL